MLSAAARLRRREDFTATIKDGRRAGRGSLVVHVNAQPRSSADPARTTPRVGFVVSRAVGGAAVRNRVKRRLRHLMRERLVTLPVLTDVVVRALPASATRTFPQLGEDLDRALAAAARPRSGEMAHPRSGEPAGRRAGTPQDRGGQL